MANIVWADPGGEFYQQAGYALAVTAGIYSGSFGDSLVSNAPTGRSTQYAILSTGGGSRRNLGANFTQLIMGMAINIPNTTGNNTAILAFYETATEQCHVEADASGHIVLKRGGTTLATSTATVSSAGWHYIELKATFATGATGSLECRVDGNVFATATSVQTTQSGNAFANQIRVNIFAGGNNYFKDIYVIDPTTGLNTTYLGDVTVAVSYPNAAGVNQTWTNTGGASQTASVQDGIAHTGSWPDDDTSYISSATLNQISDFAHQTLTLTGAILGVVHVSYGRKDDAGARSFAQVCLSGATTEVGATIAGTNTYAYYYDPLDKDPNTTLQWTTANYNAATFGVKELT